MTQGGKGCPEHQKEERDEEMHVEEPIEEGGCCMVWNHKIASKWMRTGQSSFVRDMTRSKNVAFISEKYKSPKQFRLDEN